MNIVITGCSKGIGFELAKLLSLNHKVYGISRDEKQLKKLKSAVEIPENICFYVGDVVKINQQDLNQWIPDEGIDVLVNNAGYLVNKTFKDISHADFLKTMEVNLWGAINMSQLLIDKLTYSSRY